MSTTVRTDLHVLDVGTPTWCWSRLVCSSEATLSFSTALGRFSIDVRYTLGQEQIAIAVPAPDAVGWQAAGRAATLTINGTTDEQLRWSVRVFGHAHRAGDHLVDASGARRPSGSARPAWLALSSLQVRGCYETVMLHGLPAGRPSPTGSSVGPSAQP